MEGSQATHAIEPWLQLHNKVVTVTGASSGLGWDFCLDLAKAGCRILAAARLQSLRRDQRHGRITQFELLWTSCSELDVGASGSVIEASVHKAWDAFGTIDALMNNAGVRGSVHSPLNLSEDECHNTIKTDLTGAWLVSKYVCSLMCSAKKGGSVINISSIAGLNRGSYLFVLNPASSVISHICFHLNNEKYYMAMELGAYKIRLNSIAPGLFIYEICKKNGSTVSREKLSH